MMLKRGISVLELIPLLAMASFAFATDETVAVMLTISHGVLWLYMPIVSVDRYIIKAENVKSTSYHIVQ